MRELVPVHNLGSAGIGDVHGDEVRWRTFGRDK